MTDKTSKQTRTHTHKLINKQTNEQARKHSSKQTDKQADRRGETDKAQARPTQQSKTEILLRFGVFGLEGSRVWRI